MFQYKMCLTLIKAICEYEKGLDERRNFIISQIRVFNEKSLTSPINPKHIGLGENGDDDIQISRTTLTLTLYSQTPLNTPGKALRLLSQLLVVSNHQDNLSCFVIDKKLFRTFKAASSNVSYEKDNVVNLDDVSDSELIKSLIDFICNPNDFAANKRNAVDQIKRIAIESGLINKSPDNPE